MNCDLETCGKHILATTQVAWNGGNYHAECVIEAVNQRRDQTEIPKAESNLPDDYFERLEQRDEDFYEGEDLEYQDDIDEFEDDFERAISHLDSEPVIPEIVEADRFRPLPVNLPEGSVLVAPRAIIHPPNNGSLIAGSKGSKFVSYEELRGLPVPEATDTFKPIAFYDFVTKLLDGLWDRRMSVHKDEYVISADGLKLFGLIELVNEFNGVRFAVGLRSSNDKSMKLALAVGYRVMCCSNGMLQGDYLPLAVKHTAKLELDDSLALGIDRIRRKFTGMQTAISERQQKQLSDGEATGIIYEAFTDRKFPVSLFRTVHKEYFVEPSYDEFKPRTLFSLENAFTSSFKKLQPIQQFEQTGRLGKFLAEYN